jgi:hypothetical protein
MTAYPLLNHFPPLIGNFGVTHTLSRTLDLHKPVPDQQAHILKILFAVSH